MSADRQRLTSAIRRIAKTDPAIRDLLKAADNKGGKPGSAGVGSSTDAESQRICCDGSTSGSANPGTEERDPDSSTQSGLDSTDPAKLDMGEGSLSDVTDCATGQPICFDGRGFIPPNGWDEPNEPPIDPSYTEGQYYEWRIVLEDLSFVYVYGLTRDEADANACAKVSSYSSTYTVCGINCEGDYIAISANSRTSDPFCTSRANIDGFRYTDTIAVTDNLSIRSCDTAYRADMCDIEKPPTEEAWPSDGCTNLSIQGGKIVGSKYDPDQDGSYSAPRSSIDLCDGSGNQISLAPSADGGWKTINSTTNNGYLYDSSGQQIAHIDGNEYSDPTI